MSNEKYRGVKATHPRGFLPFPTQIRNRWRRAQFCRLVGVKGDVCYMMRSWIKANRLMVHEPACGMRKIGPRVGDDTLLNYLARGQLWVITGTRAPYKWF